MSEEEEEEGDEEEEQDDCDNREEDKKTVVGKHLGEDVTEQIEDNSQANEVIERYWPPPLENRVELIGSSNGKTITAFAFDNAGTRFVSGGHDNEVKIWDFKAMRKQAHPVPVCRAHPSGGSVIKQLEFSPDDKWVLVIAGNSQAVVMARDGIVDSKGGVCAKGDQYIADMANTKGHVQMLNDGCWRPERGAQFSGQFATCSNDATIRLWSAEELSKQRSLIKTRSPANGLKTVATVCKYSRDALTIVAGCQDGSIQMWDTRRKFISTSNCVRNAHLKGSEITGLEHSYDGTKLCSRSEDESCKVWDLRHLKAPLATRTGLESSHSASDCCFSPDDRVVLAGTSAPARAGELHFMDSATLVSSSSHQLSGSNSASVLRVRWHPKINHLACTSSDGQVHVAYDSRRSLGGGFAFSSTLLLPQSTAAAAAAASADSAPTTLGQPRKKRKNFAYDTIAGAADRRTVEAGSGQAIKKIITPHALPLFRHYHDDAAAAAAAAAASNNNNKSAAAARSANAYNSASSSSSSRGGGSSSSSGSARSAAAFASATASRMRSDPKRSYKPEAPESARQGGRAAAVKPAGSTLSSYIARSLAKPGGA